MPARPLDPNVPPLVEAFIGELRQTRARRITGVTRGALERLMLHEWPGNLDELKKTLEGMALLVEGRRAMDLSDLPDSLREGDADGGPIELVVGTTLEGAERALITATLRRTGNDKPRAAAMLGMGLRTLYRKLEQYAPRPPRARSNRRGG